MKVGQNETLVIKVGVSTAYHKKIKAPYAGVAQLVEQLTCNQWVESSKLFTSTIYASSVGTECLKSGFGLRNIPNEMLIFLEKPKRVVRFH